MRTGRIMINPHKTQDGLWYADAWYGVLDTDKEESVFKRVPSTEHTGDLEATVTHGQKAALQLLQQQGVEEKHIITNIIWPEEG